MKIEENCAGPGGRTTVAEQINTRPFMNDEPYVRTRRDVRHVPPCYREAARFGIGPFDTTRYITRSITSRYEEGLEMCGWLTECEYKYFCGDNVCEENNNPVHCGHRACHTCKMPCCVQCFTHLKTDVRGCFYCRRYW